MNSLESFRLLSPGWLLLLPPVWLLVWYFARRLRRSSMWHRICEPHLLRHLLRDDGGNRASGRLAAILAALFGVGIFAATGPSWRLESYPLLDSSGARVVVLDLSRAMLVEDVKPNRFRQALAGARAVVSMPFAGETGLVVFAGAAFVVTPLSSDANTLLSFLDALEPETMPVDGNRIDLAIVSARGLLEASPAASGHIIVITGGSDDLEPAFRAAYDARQQGHRLSLVAIGTREGAPLRDPGGTLARDADGKYLLSRTDFDRLERLAEIGNGAFMSITPSAANVELLATEFNPDQLSFDDQADAERNRANDGAWLVWLMLPLIIVLFRKNLLCLILLALWVPHSNDVLAAGSDSLWRHPEQAAYGAYRRGDYASVQDLSREPLLLGAAAYRLQQYETALDWFLRDDSAAGWYNRGNSYVRLQRFNQALDAYRRALELDPGLEAATHNLRFVEAFLEQLRSAEEAAVRDEGAGSDDPSAADSARARIGISGQSSPNPGDEQRSSAGSGASIQDGRFAPEDEYDGSDQSLERFLLEQDAAEYSNVEAVEQWISNLPEASSQLFKRKFLRDYQRQKQQPR